MISVRVQRADVAAGDVWDLAAEWQFVDDARVVDVLFRALDEHFLARVAADIAWTFKGGGLEFQAAAGDAWYLRESDQTGVLATLFVNYPRGDAPAECWVSTTRRGGLGAGLSESPQFAIAGGYGFTFGYSSGGGLRALDALRVDYAQ